MSSKTPIEKFISSSIKNKVEDIDEGELDNLLKQMATNELDSFWSNFSSHKAYTDMNRNIPAWQTKTQALELSYLTLKYGYSSKENKRNKTYRSGLINHIKSYLVEHIENEIQQENDLKNRSFWEKLPPYYLISTFILIPVAIINGIFGDMYGKSRCLAPIRHMNLALNNAGLKGPVLVDFPLKRGSLLMCAMHAIVL